MLVRVRRVIHPVGKVEDERRPIAQRLVAVVNAGGDEEDDGPLAIRHVLLELAERGRAAPPVVEREKCAPGDYDDGVRLALMPVPGSDDAGLVDREDRLTEPTELGPVGTEDLGERAAVVSVRLESADANSSDHGDMVRRRSRRV